MDRRYDTLDEMTKTEKRPSFGIVEKFNPYHGWHGYFSTANAAGARASLHGKTENGQRLLDQYKEKHGGKASGGSGSAGAADSKKPAAETKHSYKKISQQEALDMAKEMGQDKIDITDPDAGELNGYFQTGASFSLNKALRKGINPMTGVHDLSEQQRNTVEVMDRNMKPASRDIKVTRMMAELPEGMHLEFGDLFDETAHPIPSQLDALVGKVPVNKGYTSTSFDEKYNLFQGYPVKLNINVPKGTPMLISPKRSPTGEVAEAEIALARGTAMKITGAKAVLDGGAYRIELECDVLLD